MMRKQEMQDTPKQKRKLLNIFLIPLVGMVVIQGVLLLSILFFSNIKGQMESNAVESNAHILENRQLALQNTMVGDWGNLTGESGTCSLLLEQLLKEKNLNVEDFLRSREAQEQYLERMLPEMISKIQQKSNSGGFLILANDSPIQEAADYVGFFIRDSDPSQKTASNTDLLVERGNKNLARAASIPLDNAWSKDFHFNGMGNRESDNFFYEPYTAGMANVKSKMINFGYWSMPFVLEDSYMDNHYMVTYSMPLQYNGTIYGVLGVEASLRSIEEYMDVRSLDSDLNAGYVLVEKCSDDTYRSITGKGMLYEYVAKSGESFTLSEETIPGLFLLDGVTVGQQKIYALSRPLNLYSNNVPYENTDWELCALVTENSVFEAGRNLYRGMLAIIIGCGVMSILVVFVTVKGVLHPVYRLMNSVRGGVEGIRKFVPSKILEIDELHEVVANVTEAQKKTQDSLLEETERYRLAIESSKDIFFTYRRQESKLEIVNTENWDGTWDNADDRSIFERLPLHPLDRKRVQDAFRGMNSKVELEFRMKQNPEEDYQWYFLFARIINDESGNVSTIVGYLRNITQRKQKELEEDKKKATDPATGFYRKTEGMRLIQEERAGAPFGVLAMLHIFSFKRLNEQYGLVFGDLLLEQLADCIRRTCHQEQQENAIFVRIGYSDILGWFPGAGEEQIMDMLDRVREQFGALIRGEILKPDFSCGFAAADDTTGIKDLFRHVLAAMERTRNRHVWMLTYEELTEKEKEMPVEYSSEAVVSVGYTDQMGLASMALNLFDRGGSVAVLLDMLFCKLQKQKGLSNLEITSYNKENMVNALEYSYRNAKRIGMVYPCDEKEAVELLDAVRKADMMDAKAAVFTKDMFSELVALEDGIAVNMKDNGQYSGTILFGGLGSSYLEDETAGKELRELATVIQNRINQEKHDLSAQAKADFLARMSHEIRTPMNGIIGMTEIALKEGQTAEKKQDCLQKIMGSSKYLLSLVNDILDMSKIESGKMQITENKSNFRKKLTDLYNLIGAKITEKHIKYTADIELEHSWFWVDELRVSQVLINILGNAIKYSYEGGSIQLVVKESKVDEETSALYFAVTDNGVGIKKDDQQLIFQSFEQARHQDGVYRQGTGLGLAISNRLVHMMGSAIHVDSEWGEGSTFSFTLHLKWAEEKPDEDNLSMEDVDLRGKRILVAEDNELNQEIIKTILEDYGVLVDVADDGQDAVDKMAASAPGYYDMILMDIMMPRLNGLEATKQIRKLKREDSRTIPIIAMTANAFAEEQKQSIASGMNAHLTKPLDMEKLQEALRTYLMG